MTQITEILKSMGLGPCPDVMRFRSAEDDTPYDVWRLTYPDKTFVLKKAKGREGEMYAEFLSADNAFAPAFIASTQWDGDIWLLLEYVPGNDLSRCTRPALTRVLDALISMHMQFWNRADALNTFASALAGREKRMPFLQDSRLESTYQAYLEEFRNLPRTLCHDDLLPFNVLVSDSGAVLIDWEHCGILPWPTSLARLLAHCQDTEDAFFYMTDADKAYAIDYFYDNFIKIKGIAKESYIKSLKLALFYEYCEWVYLGNRFDNREGERYRQYLRKALDAATDLGF